MRKSSSSEERQGEKVTNNNKFNQSFQKMLSLPRNPSLTFKSPSKEKPKSPYSAFTHQMRKIIPEELACSVGCGGEKCKYCNSDWPDELMALKGVFSNWITKDVVAMARPSTHAIEKYKIIEQMKELNIKSIFNLQMMNEHKSCGKPLEPSGFSYDPIEFTKNNIYYYNFCFADYSTVDMSKMVDMVKVFCFAVETGRVAVHCHAGLGRTGLFIASYLIYKFRMTAKDAIYYIRDKRNKSVQMNEQIHAIESFENFLKPLRIIFANESDGDRMFTLNAFVIRQRYFLHGYESRNLKYIPKLLSMCIKRLKKLLKNKNIDSLDEVSNKFVNNIINSAQKKLKTLKNNEDSDFNEDDLISNSTENQIALALSTHVFEKNVVESMRHYQNELNNNSDEAYTKLSQEKNPKILVALMWSWLDHLQLPVLRDQEIIVLKNSAEKNKHNVTIYKWDELDRCTTQTIECLLSLYRDLFNDTQSLTEENENEIILTLISILTQSSMNYINGVSLTNSQASISSTINNYDYIDDNISENSERLVYNTNQLKKEHARTLYKAFSSLIKNNESIQSSSSSLLSTPRSRTAGAKKYSEDELDREYRRPTQDE